MWKLFSGLQNKLPKALLFNEANQERFELTQCIALQIIERRLTNNIRSTDIKPGLVFKCVNKVTSVSCVVLQKSLPCQQMHTNGSARCGILHTLVLCLLFVSVRLRWAQLHGFCQYVSRHNNIHILTNPDIVCNVYLCHHGNLFYPSLTQNSFDSVICCNTLSERSRTYYTQQHTGIIRHNYYLSMSRNLEREIGSLFDPYVNALGLRSYWPLRMEVTLDLARSFDAICSYNVTAWLTARQPICMRDLSPRGKGRSRLSYEKNAGSEVQ